MLLDKRTSVLQNLGFSLKGSEKGPVESSGDQFWILWLNECELGIMTCCHEAREA